MSPENAAFLLVNMKYSATVADEFSSVVATQRQISFR
jgi:hypothetical protein